MDNKIKPLEDFVHDGLARRFTQVFGIGLTFSTSANKKQTRKAKLDAGDKYPMAFASVQSFEITENQYSQPSLLRSGLRGQQNADRALTYKLSLIPVTTTFQIYLYAQDIRTVTDFSKRWLISCVKGSLKYTITYGVADIDVHVDLDRSVSVPPRADNELTAVNEFEVTCMLRVQGYMSESELEAMQAVTNVEVNGVLIDKQQEDALTQEGREGVEVFRFNREYETTPGPAGSINDD